MSSDSNSSAFGHGHGGLTADRASQIAREIVEAAALGSEHVYLHNNSNSFLSDDGSDSVYWNPIETIDASSFAFSAPNIDGCAYLPCILGNGSRRYIKRKDEKVLESRGSSDIFGLVEGNLLQKPIQQLITEAENRQIKHIALMNQHMDASETFRSSSQDDEVVSRGTSLWVDKYAPNSFSQLLSPEKINRDVLKALKAWDDFVFRKSQGSSDSNFNSMETEDRSSGFKSSFSSGGGGGYGGYGNDMDGAGGLGGGGYDSNLSDADAEDDYKGGGGVDMEDASSGFKSGGAKKKVDRRPKQKLILLSGAPGTGKTTLAHILAKHCGYRPQEVNASDDRSEEKLVSIIFEATQSNTINGDALPNCLILDEIDGIDNRKAIDAIIDIVKAPLQSSSSSKAKGGKKDKQFALLRPIICICNDMYAPILKDLRQHCAVFHFLPPLETRLVARLKQICNTEGLPISNSDLAQLCTSTGHDIRSSINTLQFASIDSKIKEGKNSSGGASNKQSALHNMLSSGLKDDQSSAFFIWNIILSSLELGKHMHKLRTYEQASIESFAYSSSSMDRSSSGGSSSGGGSSITKHVKISAVDELMRLADEFGDNNLIISGIFENRLTIHYSDPTFMKTDFVSEWMSSMDTLDGNFSDGHYSSKYSCALFGVIHCVASSDKKIKLQFPRKDREMRYNNLKCKNILRSMQEVRPDYRGVLSSEVTIMDLLSYLIRIISPQFKSHSFTSFSEIDKKNLNNIVQIMHSFGLTFTSSFSKDKHKASFELEPPINCLVSYTDNKDADPINQLTQDIKIAIVQDMKRLNLEKSLLKIAAAAEGKSMSSSGNSFFGEASGGGSGGVNRLNGSKTPTKGPLTSSSLQSRSPPASKLSVPTGIPVSSASTTSAAVVKVDFFAPKKRSSETVSMSSTSHMSANSSLMNQSQQGFQQISKRFKVNFKFNKGFSNAVKRPVSVNDFL